MSENCRIRLNDVSLVLGGEMCAECDCDNNCDNAYITAFNSIEGAADAAGILPLNESNDCALNMTLSNNAVTIGCDGVYSITFSARLNPRINASVTLRRNGEELAGTTQTSSCGMNGFSYCGTFRLSAGDVIDLITNTPSADLAGGTNVVLSLHKID